VNHAKKIAFIARTVFLTVSLPQACDVIMLKAADYAVADLQLFKPLQGSLALQTCHY
jgi:hypothetical protein